MGDSRGNALSAYLPGLKSGGDGVQIYGDNIATKQLALAKMNAAHITGTIISSGITYAVNHGLSAVPALVVVGVRSTKAHISGGATVGESSASARTSAKFYIVGQPHGVKFAAYVQI